MLHLCRCKWRPEAQAQIPRDNINIDTPLYAYLNSQAEPNAEIHQYLVNGGGEFKGFSTSRYQKECILNNGNDILRSGNSN